MARKSTQESDLAKVAKDVEKKRQGLQRSQERLRPNPYNDKLRTKVQEAKRDLMGLENVLADLQRAVGRAKGGKEYGV